MRYSTLERYDEILTSTESQLAYMMSEKHKLERACIELAKENAELRMQLDKQVQSSVDAQALNKVPA